MNKVRIFTAAAALTAVAACAGTPPPTEIAMVDGQVVEKECRRVETMGSNLGRRVCLFPAGWEAYENEVAEQTAETLRRTQSNQSKLSLQQPGQPPRGAVDPLPE